MTRLEDIIRERILILDGAMGTMIQSYNLREEDFWNDEIRAAVGAFGRAAGAADGSALGSVQMKGNNDVLCLTRPDVVADIHRRYLAAGADIIETNTFSAQRISEADYHLQHLARKMALEGARLARQVADEYATPEKPRFVAGSIGPTNKTCSMSPDVSNPARRDLTYNQLFAAYTEQAEALIEGGVDALLIETIFDSLNSKCAIDAAMTAMQRRGVELPIMLSVTVSDLAGRTLSGQTLEAYLASVSTYPIFSIGLNCSFGARQLKPFLRELAQRAPYYISCYPNAGLPNQMGLYDETPEAMAVQMGELIDEGLVNIVGGCCGTTDAFIRQYVPLVEGKQPHAVAARPQALWLSGLEVLAQESRPGAGTAFVNVGERCNVAGSRRFLRLIREKQYNEALAIARKQVQDGAQVIDINMDDSLLDAQAEMVTFLNLIAAEPDIARVPVMIDSSKWEVIVAGLKCVQGKSIVNSISLKEGEEVFVSHARDCMRYGAAVVVMCFDEQGQATSYERRIEIASRAYRILTEEVKMNPFDIIFDPNILTVATGMKEHDAYAQDFIRAAGWIRQNLPGAHVSGGVSNLSFSFRGNNYIREAMHAVFLHHAVQQGMDFGIVNPATTAAYSDIPAGQLEIIEDVILNRKPDAAEKLIELASEMHRSANGATGAQTSAPAAQPAPPDAWRAMPLEERLAQALVKGIGDHLEADLKEALAKFPRAVDIIEGPLMAGMNRVGELFGQGKMFLPQVVKTARTMKQAVTVLQPHIEAEQAGSGGRTAGKVLLATVKGDVHDIGKNIVAVVMACNGYEVIDMGVMVPAEQIVRKAVEEQVDMIGLSGLITPSLEEMVSIAAELERAGLHIPIMIGGATTSELHVALRIAPVYSGPVVWMKDASQNALAAARLMGDGQAMRQELDEKYAHLRQDYQRTQQQLLSIDEARSSGAKLFE